MSKKLYTDNRAEKEAVDIGRRFMDSADVVGDMSQAYGADLSSVRIHTDEGAAQKARERNVDAFSTGKDVFFAQGAFDQSDPASRGLLAHELGHSLQQDALGGGESQVVRSVPEGAEQGGFIDWFRGVFGRKKRPMEISEPQGMERNESDESLAYMKAVQRATAMPDQVEGRMNQPRMGVSGSSEDFKKLMPGGVAASNESFAKDSETRSGIAEALVKLDIRGGSKSAIANADKTMRGSLFENMAGDQLDYLKRVEGQVDLGRFGQGKKTQLAFGSNSYTVGEGYDEMARDMLSMFGGYATSDESVQYLSTMRESIQNANVFTSGAWDVDDYMMQNLINRTAANPAQIANAVGAGEVSSEGYRMMTAVFKTLMTLPVLSGESQEVREALPPAMQTLLAQYNDLVEQVRQKMAG